MGGTAVAAAEHCTLFGCYTHGGHSYTTEGLDAVHAVGEAERDAVVEVARRVRAASGVALRSVGVGSTPTGSNPPEHLNGVTELHPGNFIFYDTMQASYPPWEFCLSLCVCLSVSLCLSLCVCVFVPVSVFHLFSPGQVWLLHGG